MKGGVANNEPDIDSHTCWSNINTTRVIKSESYADKSSVALETVFLMAAITWSCPIAQCSDAWKGDFPVGGC